MQLTQQQWYERLRTWVPTWFLVDELHNVAFLQSMAKVLSDYGGEVDNLVTQTFIQESVDEWVDTHGHERQVERLPLEEDSSYGPRIVNQSFISRCDRLSIKAIVDSILTHGECRVFEDYNGGSFLSRGYYCSRDAILITAIKDAFSILVPKQVHSPYNFLSRDTYCTRESYVGSTSFVSSIYEALCEAVNKNKAMGAPYRVIESKHRTVS